MYKRQVENPWAAGSPEAQEFTAGLHEGFTADDDAPVAPAAAPGKGARRKSQELAEVAPAVTSPASADVVAPAPADDTDREIEAGLADGASAADAEAATYAEGRDEADGGVPEGSDGAVQEEDPFAPATDTEIEAWFQQGLRNNSQTPVQVEAGKPPFDDVPF